MIYFLVIKSGHNNYEANANSSLAPKIPSIIELKRIQAPFDVVILDLPI